MVFESVVSYFLEKYLSCYLDNFDSSKLKIGIWSGDVVLENLEIKPNALDELNLPVRVVLGHLKQLKLKIPWKSLYTESVKVSIDGLTILIVPKSSTKYDAEREKKEQIDKKLNEVKKLNDIEAAKAEKNAGLDSEKNVEAKQDTFIEKIQLQVIRNLELQIKNIHIRYEDDFSKPEHPFSAGVTLDSIEIRTADENWNPAYLKESSKEMATNYINKLASLISCAIYCNSDEKLLNGHLKEEIIPFMQKMITDESNIKYMLKPLSLETKAILNMKPRQDNYNKPMFDFTIVLEKLGLSLNRLQYFDLIDMLNTIDQMSLYAKYRKFRPTIDEVPNVVKRRWLYSYRAIVEGQIRPKRDQYRWTRIQLVTRLRRDYVGILKKKLKGGKLTNEETETEKKCEEVLDVFNLVLAKKQADVEIARVKAIEKSTAKKSSWWGWASASSSSKEDQDKLSEAENLSQEEKLKLFDAIGYTEESTFSHYPKDYVSIKLKFLLKMFEINLIDGDYKYNDIETYISNQSILCLSLENMELGLSKYPVTDGLKVVSSIKRISLTGSSINISSHSKSNELESNGVKPVMIEPDLKDQVFIKFAFELDPTDPNCDKRITAKSRSLKIIYHAITINNIVYFFQSPEFSNHSRLKNAAIKKINQVRERSVQYMKNNLSNIRFIDVNVDIEPSFLLIPQNGVFSETTKSLCVNFGCLSLKSDATSKSREKKAIKKKEEAGGNSDEDVYLSATDDEDDLKKSVINTEADVIDASYWKYRIDLKQIQIILIDNMHDLAKMREITETDKDFQAICDRCFILRPLDLFFNMHQCVYTDDANLPVWKLFGNLPRIQIDLTETKLEQSLDLVLNLPLPKNDSISKNVAEIVDDGFIDDFEESSDISSDGESLINTLEALTTKDDASKDSATSLSSVNQKYNQAFLMELSFEINEITFRLRENKPVNFDFIEFKIESFGTSIEIKTYSNEMSIYLKKISMLYDLFNDVNGEKLYLIRSANEKCSSDLINIRILNTNEENPQFSSLYDNCLTKIDVDLCMIDFVANLIALKNLFKFTDTLQTYFHRNQQNTNVQVAELKQSNRLASNQVLLSETAIKTLLGRKTQTQTQTVNDSNLVEFKINAKFDGLRARICTTRKNYFQADMTCFETTVTGKASETVVDISLNSISVVDLDPNSIYNKVLSLKEDQNELIKLQVTLVNPPRSKNSFDAEIEKRYQKEKFYFRNYLNEEHFDIILKANISKLRAVFLFKQLNTLMAMLKIFETEQQTTSEEATIQNLTETKTSEIRNQPEESDFSFSSRVKLDVTINAPLIIVPETASSNKALLLDCGVLIVKTNLSINQNYFQKQDVELDQTCLNYRCKLPPVIEIQKVTLSKMEISKIVLEKDMEITNQLFLVDCSDLKVEVQRNMQPNVFKKIEPLSIEVIYGGLLVSLARNDYSFILKLVQNLDGKDSEIQDADLPSLKAKTPASNSKSEAAKKQVGLEDALTIVKSNIIASLTIKVFIESLRVYLFNDEDQPTNSHNILVRSNDNAFSKMEIKNLQIEVNIFEDTDDTKSNMKMLMLLDNIILDDTRHDKCGKKAIRLIEKYLHDKKSAPVSMVSMIFESKVVKQDSDSSGNQIWIPEKYIKGTVECLRLCVNVDYLLLLHQFFIEGLPNMNDQSEEILVETTTTMTQSKSLPSVQKQLEVEQPPIKQDKIICDIRIDYPQFILYENQYELKKSNSLIINGMFHAKVDLTNERIKVHTMLSDLMVRLKSVRTSSGNKQLKQSKRVIIPSTSMSLSGVIDNRPLYSVDDFNERKAQAFILDLHDINFNMSPQVLNTSLKMIASIQNSLNQKFKTEVIEVREETQVALQSIFQAVEFNTNDFWFTRPKALTRRLSASSLSSAETALTTTTDSSIGSKFNSTEMIIRTAKIFVKLEADVSEQIPLLGLSLSLHGEITNWTSKLGMSFTAAIEMAYFNESRSAWEPVIEPIEYNNDKFSPYEISIEMITNELEQSDLSKMSHRKKAKSGSSEQPNTNLLPLRTFLMHSSRSLQLVVTRTLLGMLDTISKTLALNESVDATSQVDDEYETYEREEEMLLEKLKSRKLAAHAKDQEDEVERPSTAHLENLDDKNKEHDDDSENLSFNFLIKNQLGVDVQLDALQGFHFLNLDLIDANRQPEFCIDKIVLKNDGFCPIKLANNMSTVKSAMLTNNEQDSKRKSVHFRLNITESNWEPVDVALNHLQYNAYYLSSQAKKHNETMVICETVTNMDKRRLYLRSQIQIINMFQMGVDISFPGSQSQILGFKSHTIKPGKRWSLPINILNNATNKIEIAPISPEGKYEKQTISWESDKKNVLLEFSKHIFIQVIIEKEPLDLSIKSVIASQQSMSQVDFIYDIVLLPTLTLYNYLPYSINYHVDNSSIGSKTNIEKKCLEPGESTKLVNAKVGSSYLLLEMLNYAQETWYASQHIEFNPKSDQKGVKTNEEVNMIDFRCRDSRIITLQYTCTLENSCLTFSLYAPYWILNQTTLKLEYKFKSCDDDINEIDSNLAANTPIFFKINSKAYNMPKKEIMFRVRENNDRSEWSGSFLIDTAGNKGTICARSKSQKIYEIGVDISLSTTGLTKIIKLTPYYLLINNTELMLDIRELIDNEILLNKLVLQPKSIMPFWPSSNTSNKQKNAFKIRVLSSEADLDSNIPFTSPFWYNSKHSTLLKLQNNPYTEALFVDCIPSEEVVRTVFKPYSYGTVPVLVLNCLSSRLPVVIKQNEEDSDEISIMPGKYHMKTWRNPIGKREIVWSCGLARNQIYNLDTIQSSHQFDISQTNIGFALSFLDGLQRVLMFVENIDNLSEEVIGYKKIPGDEYILDLDSLGLSLIDDKSQIEIFYMSITSSSISWGQKQGRKNNVFKAFSNHKMERLEDAYQKHIQENKSTSELVKIDEEEEVDFDKMILFVGKSRVHLERHHASSVYVNFFKSMNQTNLHLMVNKIQIDNQLHESVFPVVFAKVQPPKTVATHNINKPIIEMSMILSHSQRTRTNEMKYFKVLIQEFFVKLDIMFINALVSILTDKSKIERKYVNHSNRLFKEIESINKSFHDMFHSLEDIDVKSEKIYFDICHISPIKMHLSFSLLGSDAFKDASILLDNPFFKSIGLVLTDMQDVVFKLGYFETVNSVYTYPEMTSVVVEHYKTQVIKQAYVLLLGLDVLGNPFGVIRGLFEGVESLFYEPYAGIVQGPGEFVEGVGLGLGKLLGSTLGGAAGAFSKITGTLGKGLATLSMDKDFQASRQKNTDQSFLQNVGQNLVMGVVSGVTGIVEKPLEGAKTGQFGGFLGGLGKGLLGVVTKPTAGLVDFTSQSLEGIRKTVVQEEKVNRVRPPRCLYKDSIIRPYKLKEAQGVFILKNVEKHIFQNDRLLDCLDVSTDPKILLILTNRHLILVKENLMFKKWVLEWSYELNQLADIPKFSHHSLKFYFRTNERKLFSNKDTIEQSVSIRDETEAKKFVTKITQAISEHSS